MNEMFERESKKEKSLQDLKKQAAHGQKKPLQQDTETRMAAEQKQKNETTKVCEDRFFEMLRKYEKEQAEAEMEELDSPT